MAGVKWSDDTYFPDGDQCKIGDIIVGLRSGDNYKFDFPSTGIKDGNGNFLIAWDTIGIGSVNYLEFTNGGTGTPTKIEAIGADASIDIDITLKGGGVLDVNGSFTINGSTSINAIIDDDTMATASAINVPTSESVVAYVLSHPGGGGFYTWNEVVGTSASMAVQNGYIANNAGLVTLTLPATSVVGDMIAVQGKGAGLFRIAQNAGQTIHLGNDDTTTGATGYIEATNRYDSFEMVCITANTDWAILSGVQGIFTVN